MGKLYMEYVDEMHYIVFSVSDIGYDPSRDFYVWVYALIWEECMD